MRPKELNRLSKFLAYVLGHHPDEFGLVPDKEGFVKLKELLKAVNEEEGWRHLRKNHLNELCISHTKPSIEIVDTMVRAIDRTQLPQPCIKSDYPKQIYICVRPKAYPVVMNKGIYPRQGFWVILSSNQSMAIRLGQRIDPSPVLLTVNVQQTKEAKIKIFAFGEKLFLASNIPTNCFTGPPLPKEKQTLKEKNHPQLPVAPPTPGSFYIEMNKVERDSIAKNVVKNKERQGWKEARRRDKRRRKKDWP